MRSSIVLLPLLAAPLVPAAAIAPKDYSGHKVIRIPTNDENVAKVQGIIDDLGLDFWKYPKKAGLNADIVVPPSKVSSFTDLVDGLESEIMHEDLGASIKAESTFEIYEGKTFSGSIYPQDRVLWNGLTRLLHPSRRCKYQLV